MEFWIDIETPAGNRLGDGPISTALYWDKTERLDRAGDFAFSMPLSDPRSALVVEKRVAHCWAAENGKVVDKGSGVIDQITVRTDADGRKFLDVSGGLIERELTYRSVGFLQLSDGNGGGVSNALAQIMSFAPPGWTISPDGYGSTISDIYAAFAGELILNALVKLAEHTGEHFRFDGRSLVWLRKNLQNSGVRAVQDGEPDATKVLIRSLERVKDSYELVTRIYPYGAGNADARLTLATCTQTPPAGYALETNQNRLICNAAESAYGIIVERYLSWKDIGPVANTDLDLQAAANTLYQAAYEHLRRFSQPQQSYRLEIRSAGAQLLLPGQTIRVVYQDWVDGYKEIDLDTDLVILEVTTRLDAGGQAAIGLQVSTVDRWPTSGSEIQASQIAEGRVFEAHPQLSANSYVTAYSQAMDSGAPARFDFWLGKEVTMVNQVALRFRVDPLRSTVKASAAGGGTTVTSEDGGGGAVTSEDGGGQTADGGAHLHVFHVFDISHAPSPDPVYFDVLDGFGGLFASGVSGTYDEVQVGVSNSHEHTINPHKHTINIPPHSHSVQIQPHTHPMVYGIFEESQANTLDVEDLSFRVNGGSDLSASVVELGNGWYELDLTAAVADPVSFRPNQAANRLEISTAVTEKTAQITGQLVVRNIIQAIAVI